MWFVLWNKLTDERKIDSAGELRSLLKELHNQYRGNGQIVQVRDERGNVLLVGIGLSRSVLVYTPPEKWPTRTSIGKAAPDGESEVFTFYMGTHHSPVSQENTISIDESFKAVEYFCRTGKPDPRIDWQVD